MFGQLNCLGVVDKCDGRMKDGRVAVSNSAVQQSALKLFGQMRIDSSRKRYFENVHNSRAKFVFVCMKHTDKIYDFLPVTL